MNTAAAHWQKPHLGEHRLPVSLVVLVVIVLQFSLPNNLSLSFQKWICLLEFLILLSLYAFSPKRLGKHHPPTRRIGFILTSVITISNTASAVKLISELISGGIGSATQLLASGGSIWLTNVVIFSVWFWDLDRGGPGSRAEAKKESPDFLFPQMSDPSFAPKDWHPQFFDYLYVSFTNASAFSPTDVLPLTRPTTMSEVVDCNNISIFAHLVDGKAVNILH